MTDDRAAGASRQAGIVLGVLLLTFATIGPSLTANSPTAQFADAVYAPPMWPRVIHNGRLQGPFVYPLQLEDRLEHRYAEDRSRPMALHLFRNGALVTVDPATGSPRA